MFSSCSLTRKNTGALLIQSNIGSCARRGHYEVDKSCALLPSDRIARMIHLRQKICRKASSAVVVRQTREGPWEPDDEA